MEASHENTAAGAAHRRIRVLAVVALVIVALTVFTLAPMVNRTGLFVDSCTPGLCYGIAKVYESPSCLIIGSGASLVTIGDWAANGTLRLLNQSTSYQLGCLTP